MSSRTNCARCGATTSAEMLDGLCLACVGRGIFSFEIPPADWADDEFGENPRHLAIEEKPGGRVGAYRLIRQIGEGGFGVVYLAEQIEPVKRQVALKIIKLGMDTRQVVARFQAERQAVAMMDHPGIAKVFEAGATETGRPYFVMEFVEGTSITQFAESRRLLISARLELFIKVCDAVQHAHQKGVIHRDLKPSNILVAMQDDHAVPKVIDFGLVKATQVELTEQTLVTHFQQLIGTPAYMSPEQVEMGAVDVDTRSDIYSLGVVLYELLTGRTPFDTQDFLRGGMGKTARRIREQEPSRPSTRLRFLTEKELADSARQFQLAPEKLSRQVRGDLDWIVMKALEKNRTRRYETASALALDLRRHLRSEPVHARPPSALDQFQKLVRRNKLAVASAAAVMLALSIGLGVATVAFVKERHARKEASDRAEESRQRLVRLKVAAGNKLLDEGDDFNALLWFTEAARLDEGNAERADVHRRRIGFVLRSAPKLAQLWWHDGLARDAEFSHDGELAVSASWDGTARIWDTRTGRPAIEPLRSGTALESAQFTSDGKRIIALDYEAGQTHLWNAQTGEMFALPATAANWAALDLSSDDRWLLAGVAGGVQLFHANDGTAAAPVVPLTFQCEVLHFSPDGRSALVGGTNGDAVFLEMPSGRVRRTLPNTKRLGSIGFSPDGGKMATTNLRQIRLWDTATGELMLPMWEPGGDLYDCEFSPDGRRLAVASWAGFARVFDAASGLPVGLPMRHPNAVTNSVFSADGRWLATASRDGTARVWNSENGEPVSPPLPHAGIVYSARFSPDGSRLLTASQDWSVRLWELRNQHAARLILNIPSGSPQTQFSPDGTRLLTASADGAVRIWNVRSGEMLATFPHGESVSTASFSSDGQRVITGTSSGAVRVWDAVSAVEIFPALHLSNALVTLAFSADGKQFLTASGDRARVWSALEGEAITPWLQVSKAIHHAAFSPDGRRVITGGLDARAQIWDAKTGAPIGPAMKHPCGVSWVAFSHDGRRVVTACSDPPELPRYAQVWDAFTGQPLGAPMRHQDGVFHAEFSADDRRIATAGEDDCAMIWDSATGQPLVAPLPHRDDVPLASFSPDGRLLLTVSLDFTARVWDAMTGEPVTPPLRHDGPVLSGAWRPDGREVATCSADGTVRIWDVSPTPEPSVPLRREAELLSAHRIEANIGPVPLTAEEMKERWEEKKKR